MNWLEIQEKLNSLNDDYLELENDKLFLQDEKNYETQRRNINNALFYFVKAIKNKINEIPNSLDEVRNKFMVLGNDTNKIGEYLSKLDNDFKLCETGMEVLKTILDVSNKTYYFADGFENSLSCKQKTDYMEKTIEMMDRDDLTIEEKYDYIDSFDKNLSIEDKGELLVQTLIGEDENHIIEKKTMKLLFPIFKGDIRKLDDYYQFNLEVGAVAESRMDNEPLEEHLKWFKPILESPFVKSMKQDNKSK